MYFLQHKLLFDIVIPMMMFVYGFIFTAVLFIVIVFVEAIAMKQFFPELTFRRCSFYSIFVNLLSSLLGLPIAYLFANTTTMHTFFSLKSFMTGLFELFVASSFFSPVFIIPVLGWWLLLAFVVTLISEFVFYKYVLKSKSIWNVFKFTVISNFESYAIAVMLSYLVPSFLLFGGK